ncbi:hypothetical protein LAZ67_2002820 [Cordylochernes scorpioides]|uniref:Transposase n=1 Tax=Cordylochernes scorpioides TaxID=51811 RepID=A0ABY6K5H5_9ARAC|nr:hypothetical protein LAZ67_2002820 [Cordylochernes scorpioides]
MNIYEYFREREYDACSCKDYKNYASLKETKARHFFTMDLKSEQRVCIKFWQKLGKMVSEMFQMLKEIGAALSQSKTFKWFACFKSGRESTQDDVCQGRPPLENHEELTQKIGALIKENTRTMIREVVEEKGTEDLGLERKFFKFVPKTLSEAQKEERVNNACEDWLLNIHEDPNFLTKVITGDEPESMGMTQRPNDNRASGSRKMTPNRKKQECLSIVHYEFLPQGQTINQHVYLVIFRCLRESIRKKRPEKWISGEWMLHYDNAPAHRALSVGAFKSKNSILTIPHPPYSPDLAPNDFFLFPRMKSVLKGHRFDTVNAIKEKLLAFSGVLLLTNFLGASETGKKE